METANIQHPEAELIGFRVLKSAITSELIAKLGPERWMLLCIIAAHMDEKGECWPSQTTLAMLAGKNRCTISRWVNSLLEFRWNGEAIFVREMRKLPNSQAEYSHYKILPAAQVMPSPIYEMNDPVLEMNDPIAETNDPVHLVYTKNTDISDPPVINCNNSKTAAAQADEATAAIAEDLATAQSVIRYFCQRYRKKYNANYSPNWPRETKLVKKNLMGQYSSEQLRQMVDISVEMYEKWGSLQKFPRPSIAALATWMAEKALAVAQQREVRMNIPEHGGRTDDELLALIDRI
ncbi:helix-turn-helix domain-containing protein [Heliophilum fasciatum]|uniref:Helix-turn-helix protein n=1 Tax=Heliophilum fasciatum TaxID=35700 RepID=A0A4R2RIH3_9FIRM|nr:helix-turn-helix domain-containing protein [Heliophilum fasciatum]MCW2278753.1 hypothetical protein [Heliophilum fasciatum]TCP62508.1 helix-turn-helix protein [Heliophilum fasciatum]